MTRLSRYTTFLAVAGLLFLSITSEAGAKRQGGSNSISWGLTDCDAIIALVPIEADSVQPHLPRGFTAIVPDSVRALLPPDPRLEAVMGIEALVCQNGTGLAQDVAAMDYGSVWTFVEPPASLADESYPLSFFKWDTLVPDQPRRRFLSSRGLPVVDGDANLSSWYITPAGIVFDATLELKGGGSHRLTGAAGAPIEFTGRLIEFQKGRGGLAEWRTAYGAATALGGGGTVELEGGSFPAEVVGAQRAQAYFLVGTGVDFTDGSITFPRK